MRFPYLEMRYSHVRRRKRSISMERHVEVMLVADKSMSDFYKDDLEEYLLSIMNSVRRMLDISVGRGCQGFISHIITNMCAGALSITRLLMSTVSFVCVSTPLFSVYLRFSLWLSATVSLCSFLLLPVRAPFFLSAWLSFFVCLSVVLSPRFSLFVSLFFCFLLFSLFVSLPFCLFSFSLFLSLSLLSVFRFLT